MPPCCEHTSMEKAQLACVLGAAIKTGPRFYVVAMFRRKLDNLNIISSISTSSDGPSVLRIGIVSLWCVLFLIGMFLLSCVCFIFSFISFKSPCGAVTANSISVGQIKEYLLSKRNTNGQLDLTVSSRIKTPEI